MPTVFACQCCQTPQQENFLSGKREEESASATTARNLIKYSSIYINVNVRERERQWDKEKEKENKT